MTEGTAQLRRDVVSDLRSYDPLLDALEEPGGPDNPVRQINDIWNRPNDPPPASLIIDVYTSGGRGTVHNTVNVMHIVEAGLTVTEGWRERHTPGHADSEVGGTNPGLEVDRIVDHISERAHRSFGVPMLRFDGRFGGGSVDPPGDDGSMSRVAQWSYRRDRGLTDTVPSLF